jgi:glycosyltransferase involved in cell wall biosynthesis
MNRSSSKQILKTRQDRLPLVTTITPTYNRAPFLAETIESILNQDYPNIECIVLDDGSKDNTLEVLNKYKDKITIISHQNMGEARTVNKGLELANGEFICIVNDDDPILPGLISKSVAVLTEAPSDVLVSYPDWREINLTGQKTRDIFLPQYFFNTMIRTFNVGIGPGIMMKRAVLDVIGLRNPNVKYTSDLDYLFRIVGRGKLIHIPEILATHRTHPTAASTTSRNKQMAQEVANLAYYLFKEPYCQRPVYKIWPVILSRAHKVAAHHSDKFMPFMYHQALSLFYVFLAPKILLRKVIHAIYRKIYYRLSYIYYRLRYVFYRLRYFLRTLFSPRLVTKKIVFKMMKLIVKNKLKNLRAL